MALGAAAAAAAGGDVIETLRVGVDHRVQKTQRFFA
jgi:hypothetical protein